MIHPVQRQTMHKLNKAVIEPFGKGTLAQAVVNASILIVSTANLLEGPLDQMTEIEGERPEQDDGIELSVSLDETHVIGYTINQLGWIGISK